MKKHPMPPKTTTIKDYLAELPAERIAAFTKLRNVILKNLPKGYEETISYGMIGYVVPHKLFPAGYHCDPKLPLGLANIASQKNFIALYHMGLYGDSTLNQWFTSEYPKHCKTKLDMGKACVRFKKMDDIHYTLIGELMKKLSVKDWIDLYQENLSKHKK